MEFFSILLFALALNMDALGAGVSYGAKTIRLPFPYILFICLMSVVSIILSMTMGTILSNYIPASLAPRLGGIILLCIGVWSLFHALVEKKKNAHSTEEEPITLLQLRILGLIIRIIKEPHTADLDQSGSISFREAFLLGIALAMDALGSGFAVSMMNFHVWGTAITVGIGQIFTICLGLYLGSRIGKSRLGSHLVALPGCILIALGILKLY